jgi:hypothetical protein
MADVDEREARDPFSGPRADLGRRAETTDTIIIGVAVIAGLYFGREVLVPMSIAVLLVSYLPRSRTLSAISALAGSRPFLSQSRWPSGFWGSWAPSSAGRRRN